MIFMAEEGKQDIEESKEDMVYFYKISATLYKYHCKVCPIANEDIINFPLCYIAKNAIDASAEIGGMAYKRAKEIPDVAESPVSQKIEDGLEKINNKKSECNKCYKQSGMEDTQKGLNLK